MKAFLFLKKSLSIKRFMPNFLLSHKQLHNAKKRVMKKLCWDNDNQTNLLEEYFTKIKNYIEMLYSLSYIDLLTSFPLCPPNPQNPPRPLRTSSVRPCHRGPSGSDGTPYRRMNPTGPFRDTKSITSCSLISKVRT